MYDKSGQSPPATPLTEDEHSHTPIKNLNRSETSTLTLLSPSKTLNMPFGIPRKELLWRALAFVITFTFALLLVLLILVAADCFGEIAYISTLAHWVREYTKLIWVPIYYIGWAMQPFKPIIAPPYAALCVRAWKAGKLLPMLLYGNTFLMDPIANLVGLLWDGKKELGQSTLAGIWVGILGLVGAELLGWSWDWGLFDLLGVPGGKTEKDSNGDAEKGENGTGLREEQAIEEMVQQDARLIDIW